MPGSYQDHRQKPIHYASTSPQLKKQLGYWGEEQLDRWMLNLGWQCTHRNLHIPHGEIDRVYTHLPCCKNQSTQLCIAEVKTLYIRRKDDLYRRLGPAGLEHLLRKGQIQNLQRFGLHMQSQHPQHQVILRVFIIIKTSWVLQKHSGFNLLLHLGHGGLRLCALGEKGGLFSLDPLM